MWLSNQYYLTITTTTAHTHTYKISIFLLDSTFSLQLTQREAAGHFLLSLSFDKNEEKEEKLVKLVKMSPSVSFRPSMTLIKDSSR